MSKEGATRPCSSSSDRGGSFNRRKRQSDLRLSQEIRYRSTGDQPKFGLKREGSESICLGRLLEIPSVPVSIESMIPGRLDAGIKFHFTI